MNYSEKILNKLISIYEKRDANSSNFRTKIKIKINSELFPEYFEDCSGYDVTFKKLADQGYITIHMIKHDDVIDYISLNIDKVDEIKRMFGMVSVSDKRKLLLKTLSNFNDPIIKKLEVEIKDRISNGKSIKKYLNDDFIDAIKIVHYMENMQCDIYERNASNAIFKDSKRIAELRKPVIQIYEDENIFEEKGILCVPSYLYLKGNGIIHINEETINLSKLNTSIGIPMNKLDIINFDQIDKVTTIENLTTFYNYQSDGLIIYLGGFSTRSQMKILNKLKIYTSNFYHFGDIDYGGYLILTNLMETLNLDIKTINMDLETLINNLDYCQKINDEKYLGKLKSLLDKPLLTRYYDVIQYLIDHQVWLEQESLYSHNQLYEG